MLSLSLQKKVFLLHVFSDHPSLLNGRGREREREREEDLILLLLAFV